MAKKIEIDWPTVDKLCQLQCTGEEIASVLGCSYDTLERRVKEEHTMKCAEYIRQKAMGGRASLRRKQWAAADKGNVTMLIWLGKQYLGQKDKHEDEDQDEAIPLNITFNIKDAVSDVQVTNAKP